MNKAPSSLHLEANRKIDDKIQVLELWSTNGIPWKTDDQNHQPLLDSNDNRVLDYFPTDCQSFSIWDGQQNCADVRAHVEDILTRPLGALNRKTVAKSAKIQYISELLTSLEAKASAQVVESDKVARIRELEEQIQRLKKLVAAQEADVVALNLKATKAVVDYRREKDRHASNKRQWQSERRALETSNADLVKQLTKVISLRGV